MHQSIGVRFRVLLGCSLTITACDGAAKRGDAAEFGGSIVVATQNEPRTLLPPVVSQIDEKIIADQIFEPLAFLGDEGRLDGGFRPAIADTWEWERDSTAIVFRLNPKAHWQDGAPLRASDVTFTYELFNDSIVSYKDRASLARIDSVTARDSMTVMYWYDARYPEQFFDAASRMQIVPAHLLSKEPRATLRTAAFGRQPVGSGRFRVGKWTANESVELVADTTHYRGRPKLDRVIFAIVPDANAVSARLTTGELDVGRSEEHT